MAIYTIVFRAPKPTGSFSEKPSKPVKPETPLPLTDLNDYKYIRNVFQSSLVKGSGKYIVIHNTEEEWDEQIISDGPIDGKQAVRFTSNIKFTPHSLRGEVSEERLDKDTTVYFINSDIMLQTMINNANDGDVIAMLEDQILPAPLTCEDKVVVIDMCGCNILCKFEGDVENTDNLSVKNSVPGVGEIKKYVDPNAPEIPTVEVTPDKPLADAMEEVPEGGAIKLPAGKMEEPINITKPVSIVGADDGSTVIKGQITVPAEVAGDVGFEKVTFAETQSSAGTGGGKNNSSGNMMQIAGDTNVTIKDCTIEDAKYFYNMIRLGEDVKSIVIDGLHVKASECYHVFESYGQATDITIKNCVFEENACSHNVLSFYDFAEGSKVVIENNKFIGVDAMRFSNLSSATADITIRNNVLENPKVIDAKSDYDAGRSSGKWYAGIIFQKYKEDMDFSKMTVHMIGNTMGGKLIADNSEPDVGQHQLWYTYCSKTDWGLSYPVVDISAE